jgi:adenosylmethionine-8-amino-7-oxononanoate aminotransferase
MSDFVVLGTDTDAGKTTFALLWLTAFPEFAYWKPVETGESDTDRVRRLVPGTQIGNPVVRLSEPVAPPLAARRVGLTIPSALSIAAARPSADRPCLIETFGGPLSPLNESELQVALVRWLRLPAVLVTGSAVGAVTRALTSLQVLRTEGIDVRCVALIGEPDPYAAELIATHSGSGVASLRMPADWDTAAIRLAAEDQRSALAACRSHLFGLGTASVDTELARRDAETVWHPYTSLREGTPPLGVVRAQDEFLHLADGRCLIDGISSWWTILHGHRDPHLLAALHRATDQIDHVHFAGVTHPWAVACAKELLKTAPWSGGRVFFSDNGSTAVEVALKMAYQFWCHRGEPRRTLFVGFEGGYHGDTFGAMAVSRDRVFFGRFEPLLFRTYQVPVQPDLLDVFLSRRHPEVAAVVIEPVIQAAGGMRLHSPQLLRDLHAVARRHHVLFIVDEVMTAFRTGETWAHTAAGITPDFICAAKTLAGGVLPLAATLVSPEVLAAFDTDDRAQTFFHGHSFTAHPLACAVAVENLLILADGRWRQQAERIQNRWEWSLYDLGELPGVRNARACGTMLAIDVGTGGYLAETGRRMRAVCVERGVLLRPLGNVLYALPPLCTSDESLGRIVEAMRAAIHAVGS